MFLNTCFKYSNIFSNNSKITNEIFTDEPYSPEDSDPESGPVIPDKRSVKPTVADLSTLLSANAAGTLNTTDISSMLNSTMKTSSFLDGGASALPSFEPFNNKFDGIPGEEFQLFITRGDSCMLE